MKLIMAQNPFSFSVPVGGAVLWYGLATQVPYGWEIYSEAANCFFMGAAPGSLDLTLSDATHTHTLPNTGADGVHTHAAGAASVAGGGGPDEIYSIGSQRVAPAGHGHNGAVGISNNVGTHVHTLGNSGAVAAIPTYYRLYWIRATL